MATKKSRTSNKKSRTSNKKSNDKQKKLLALVLVVLFIGLGVLLVVSSYAARGGRTKRTNSYNLATAFATVDSMGNPLQGDKNSDGVINFGDTIGYTFTWPNTGGLIQVGTTCTQNGAIVLGGTSDYGYDGTDAIFPWTQWFRFETSVWTSGGANCTAELYSVTNRNGKFTNTTLGTINFTVYP